MNDRHVFLMIRALLISPACVQYSDFYGKHFESLSAEKRLEISVGAGRKISRPDHEKMIKSRECDRK